jgi:hypothetical protein
MNPETTKFESILVTEITDFLHHQRALGKRFINEERSLRLFDRYLVSEKIKSRGRFPGFASSKQAAKL